MGYEFEPEDGGVVDRVMTVFRPEFDGDGCVEDETLGAWGRTGSRFPCPGSVNVGCAAYRCWRKFHPRRSW
jgi:hypothetical protein